MTMRPRSIFLLLFVAAASLIEIGSSCGNDTAHQVIKMEFTSDVIKDGKFCKNICGFWVNIFNF
jgi:hypothetical protein